MQDLPGSKSSIEAAYSIVIANKDVSNMFQPKAKAFWEKREKADEVSDQGNQFSLAVLKKMLDGVREHCPNTQVVYVRNRQKYNPDFGNENVFGTNVTMKPHTDFALLKDYKFAVNMEDVHDLSPNVNFNERQLRVLAKNNCFISTRGGFQALTAFAAGGKHIVKQVRGKERSGFYNRQGRWGATVSLVHNDDSLDHAFTEEILAGGCKMCNLLD